VFYYLSRAISFLVLFHGDAAAGIYTAEFLSAGFSPVQRITQKMCRGNRELLSGLLYKYYYERQCY
jgi:hypothetical protein